MLHFIEECIKNINNTELKYNGLFIESLFKKVMLVTGS